MFKKVDATDKSLAVEELKEDKVREPESIGRREVSVLQSSRNKTNKLESIQNLSVDRTCLEE